MTDQSKLPPWLEKQVLEEAGLGIPEMNDRDLACTILPDLDYEAQLIAIASLLRRQGEVDARTIQEIKDMAAYAQRSIGLRNQQAVDEWVELLDRSTYQDAAHSMAALGMLAPLVESMFYQAFQGIRQTYYGPDVIPAGSLRTNLTVRTNSGTATFTSRMPRIHERSTSYVV